MRYYPAIIILMLITHVSCYAQRMTREDYIAKYKDIAIEKMKEYGIPASITLAQGILESGNGNSLLARRANNHFGIKCHKGWKGKTFHFDDDERNECFRKYKNAEESFRDHSFFLTERDRYSKLFRLKITDYRSWAYELKKAGYATNPKYPELLIKIITENELDRYDRIAIEGEPTVASKPKPGKNYYIVSKGDYPAAGVEGNRDIYINNGVKFIIAQNGDNFQKIAADFNIYSWQVYKYNDLTKKDELQSGQMIYLEKKKSKGSKPHHVVEAGESMYSISQRFGIRLKKLYKKNKMKPGTETAVGKRIKLR